MNLRSGLIATMLVALATCASPLLAQQVAPETQPVWNQNGSPQPVTSSSGLPVNCIQGCSGGAAPTPIPTPAGGIYPVTQSSVPWSVSCLAVYPCGFPTPVPIPTGGSGGWPGVNVCTPAAATCAGVSSNNGSNIGTNNALDINAFPYWYNGTNWQPVGPASPFPVTTPAPAASVSPVPYPAQAHLHIGSGTSLYLDTWPDTIATSTAISSATTTLIASGVANQNMYVFFVAFQSTGTNSSPQFNLEYGQGATCGTGTVTIFPNNTTAASFTTAGNQVVLYGGSTGAISGTTDLGMVPAVTPLIVPANASGNNLCGVTAGTTIAGKFFALVANHAN